MLLLLLWRVRRSMRGSVRALHADTVISVLWRGRQQRGAIPHWLLARPLTRPLASPTTVAVPEGSGKLTLTVALR